MATNGVWQSASAALFLTVMLCSGCAKTGKPSAALPQKIAEVRVLLRRRLFTWALYRFLGYDAEIGGALLLRKAKDASPEAAERLRAAAKEIKMGNALLSHLKDQG